jgi:putative peptidoglycan lipid II flippase
MIFVGQWGIIVINRYLSEMPLGSLANFGYAWKMVLIVGLLPASLATVIFPAFSDAQALDNNAEFSRLVTRAIKMTLFLTLPLASILFVEQLPLISFMFERGAMSSRDVVETAQLFGLLIIGAPASALWVVLNKASFAMLDKKSPLVVTIAIAIGITLLVPYAAKTYGANGIALILSTMPLAGTLSLLSYQIYKYGIVQYLDIVLYFGKLVVLCIGVALPVLLIRYFFHAKGEVGITLLVTEIFTVNVVAIASIFWLSRLLGIFEMDELRCFMLNQFCKLLNIKRLR